MPYDLLPYKNEYCYTIYHLNCHTLYRGHYHSYLGIMLSQDLKWANHVAQISSIAKQTLGVIRRNFRHTSKQSKFKLYCSLVRPKLEYAGSAWYPYLQKDKYQPGMVQRSAARCCFMAQDSQVL